MTWKTRTIVFAAVLTGACSDQPSAQDRYEAGLAELAETRRQHMEYELQDLRAEMARAIRSKGFECDRVIAQDQTLLTCQTSRGEVNYRLRANGDIVVER